MTVANGQIGNETTFNAAFGSRTNDWDTLAKVDLKNTDVLSGPNVINLQASVNGKRSLVTNHLALANGSQIQLDERIGMHTVIVQGNTGAISLNAVPFNTVGIFGGAYLNGTIVEVIGNDDTNTVTIANNDAAGGAIANGDALHKKYSSSCWRYLSHFNRWVEICRSL
jgi:hypothetical protein